MTKITLTSAPVRRCFDLFDDKAFKVLLLLNKETASSIQRKGGSGTELQFFVFFPLNDNMALTLPAIPETGQDMEERGGGQRSTPSFHCPADPEMS